VTAGFGPPLSISMDLASNRILGGSYDANGNPSAGEVWDVENRLNRKQGRTNTGHYGLRLRPVGRRIWKETPGGLDGNGNPYPPKASFYFYGATGQKLETYTFLRADPGPEFGQCWRGSISTSGASCCKRKACG